MEVKIEYVSGLCPVQAEGTIGGKPFYFRARHGQWRLCVADTQDAAVYPDTDELRAQVRFWTTGDDPTKGYMPEEAVRHIIEAYALCYAESLKVVIPPKEAL